MEGDPKLRDELYDLTETEDKDKIKAQLTLIPKLSKTIRVTVPVDFDDRDTWGYKCHAFTFDIQNTKELRTLRDDTHNWGPEGPFVKSLMGTTLKEISKDESEDGDFVVYFSDGKVKHSGIRSGDLVESKWGRGHTWKHGLWEVPSKYGCEVRYYRKVPSDELLAKFLSSLNKPEKG